MMNGAETKELLFIETEDFTLYIKGMPYNARFQSLSQYRTHSSIEKERMVFKWNGEAVETIEIYDVENDSLKELGDHSFSPTLF
jgi:uncharacterized protein